MTQTLTLSSLPLFPLASVLFPDGCWPCACLRCVTSTWCANAIKQAPHLAWCPTQGSEVRRAGAPDEQFHDVGTLAVIEQPASPSPD